MQFVIRCVSCENKCEKMRHSIKYLKNKYSHSPSKNIREKKAKKYLLCKLRREEASLVSLQDKINASLTASSPSNTPEETSKSEGVNLRAMMAAFYQCGGPRDVGNTMSFLGVPGGNSFPKVFYNNMEHVTQKMNKELQVIIDEGFNKEIQGSIQYELAGDYSQD